MATGLFTFIMLLGIIALVISNGGAISSLDLSDSDDMREQLLRNRRDVCYAFNVKIGGSNLMTTCNAYCRQVGRGQLRGVCIYVTGIGEIKSAFFSNMDYYGGDDDDYEDEYGESDDDDNGQISISLSFNTQDTRDDSSYGTRSNNNGDEYRYMYLGCRLCYYHCSRYNADYKCDGKDCYCIPIQQTSTHQNSYGYQRNSGTSCSAYSLQIVGSGLQTTCDAFCRTIGVGKLIGVCVYNQCTCEAMQQNYYSNNGYSGYQQQNRYYRSTELLNNTQNAM